MTTAKDLIVKPISSSDARRIVKKIHYSGKVVNNSTLHLGVFLNGKCEGVMQFGSPLDKRKVLPLVKGTDWNEMLELNRMAFSEALPKNSESRAIGVAMRLIKKNYPHIKWVLSFSDATQCGDGAIYRASGFFLTGLKVSSNLRVNPRDGKPMQSMTASHKGYGKEFKNWSKLKGFQLRYIYLIDKTRTITVPILPFSKIAEMDAGMYRGKKIKRGSIDLNQVPLDDGGAIPTSTLHSKN